jgi:hypothetical protein
MNTPQINRTATTSLFSLGAALLAATLVALTVSFVLMSQFKLSLVPVKPASGAQSALARHAAFKQRQAEQAADAATLVAPAPWHERYLALKDAQAEAGDRTVVPTPVPSGRQRFYEFKQRQAELIASGS